MKKRILCAILASVMVIGCIGFTGCNNKAESGTSSAAIEPTEAKSLNFDKTAATNKSVQLGELTNIIEQMKEKYKEKKVEETDLTNLCSKLLELQLSVNNGTTTKDEALKSTVKFALDFVNSVDLKKADIKGNKDNSNELLNKIKSILTSISTELGINSTDNKDMLEIISTSQQVNVNKTIQLSIAQSNKKDIKGLKFTWQSDNKDVITVDKDGKAKGIKEGKSTISVKCSDGRTAFKLFECISKDKKAVVTEHTNPAYTTLTYYTTGNDDSITKIERPVEVTPPAPNNSNNSNNSSSTGNSNSSQTNNNSSSTVNSKPSSNNDSSSTPTPPTPPTSSKPASSQPTPSKVWHEAEYKTVNHPAETKQVWVVDKAAYSYEEPVYEEHGRTLCNDCNADLTDMSASDMGDHCVEHGLNGGKGSYRDEWVEIQVGTKTVTVPEEGHYETQTVKDAWTEKVLVKDGYWA